MPRIELIDVPLYNPNDPYHWVYDNLPLENIIKRQELINLSLDDLLSQTKDAIGTQGTLANRLNQSIDSDGSLKKEAIDDALHSMGDHTDDTWDDPDEYDTWVATRSAPFVRMEKTEADKLANISDNATNFYLKIQEEEDEDAISFSSGTLTFIPSSTLSWEIVSPNKIKANLSFPVASAHRHYYDQTPVHYSLSDPDYKKYKVNSVATAYVSGSLRVFVNGIRLTKNASIYVPGFLVSDVWTILTYTEDAENGVFTFSAALSEDDVVYIDYNTQYVE